MQQLRFTAKGVARALQAAANASYAQPAKPLNDLAAQILDLTISLQMQNADSLTRVQPDQLRYSQFLQQLVDELEAVAQV